MCARACSFDRSISISARPQYWCYRRPSLQLPHHPNVDQNRMKTRRVTAPSTRGAETFEIRGLCLKETVLNRQSGCFRMPKPAVRVGVNGFGVIGKRVAEAVSRQKDMKLIGVSDVVADYRVKMGQKKNLAIYSSIPEKPPDMKKARVVVFRRGTDPWESHKNGLINTVVPEAHIPSHQRPDAQTVLPKLDITTMAAKGPFNIGHLHFAMVQLKNNPERKDVLKVLKNAPRLAPVRTTDGVDSMNAVAEMMRDLHRARADMWEVAYWE